MKKWLISVLAIVIILIAILFFLPLMMGKMVENNLMKLPSTDEFKFQVLNYHRGWFSSDALIKITLKNPNTSQLSLQALQGHEQEYVALTLREHIVHGPIMLVRTETGALRLMVGQAYATGGIRQANTSANNATLIKLNGQIDTRVNAPIITYQNPTLKIFTQVKNLLGEINISRNMSKIVGQVSIDEVNYTNPISKQQFQKTLAKYDLHKTAEELFVGDRSVQLGVFTYTNIGSNQSIIARDLSLATQSDETHAKINLRLEGKLNSVTMGDKQFGPHNFALAMTDMDAPALYALTRQVYTMPGKNDLTSQIAKSLQIARYDQLLMALFSKGMQVHLKQFNVVTQWGKFNSNADFIFNPLSRETVNPFALLQSVDAKMHVLLPREMVMQVLTQHYEQDPAITNPTQQAQLQIQEWTANKWLIPEGDSYNVNITYKNREAAINGEPFPKKSESAPALEAPTATQPVQP